MKSYLEKFGINLFYVNNSQELTNTMKKLSNKF